MTSTSPTTVSSKDTFIPFMESPSNYYITSGTADRCAFQRKGKFNFIESKADMNIRLHQERPNNEI